MVTARRLGHLRKSSVVPRKLPRFDEDAAHRRAVSAEVLRHGMNDDVRAMLERPAEVGRSQRVVDHERNACVVRDLRDGGEVGDVELRIADGLDVDSLGVVANRRPEVRGIVAVDERRLDAELREGDRKLRVRAAVEGARRDDVVAVRAQREERDGLRCHAGGGRECRAPSLQRRHALLEGCDGRVRDARVDVAEGRQVEKACRVVRVVEDERRRLVDRQCAGARGAVGNVPRVQAQRVESELAVRHSRAAAWPRSRRYSRPPS